MRSEVFRSKWQERERVKEGVEGAFIPPHQNIAVEAY
jgi:hypothetical protein